MRDDENELEIGDWSMGTRALATLLITHAESAQVVHNEDMGIVVIHPPK